jgi:3-oxoacyl-[acyl-carrier protein] reductase
MARRALVLGGSGYVGGAVVRDLRARGLDVFFTYLANEAKARDLAEQTGAKALKADLYEMAQIERVCAEASEGATPTVLVHACARFDPRGLDEIDGHAFSAAMKLGVRAPLFATKALAKLWKGDARADVVILGALDRGQNTSLPPCFAAAEGAKGALAMALAKELGPKNVRVNMVALGLLEGGSSARIGEGLSKDFAAFSALGRRGTAEEAARVVTFLALDSDFLTARTIAVNGGL